MPRVVLLQAAMDEAYDRLRGRLDGLTDREYFWEPAADCWTVRQDTSGRWTYDYAIPHPDPAPLTTIGWQLVHLATCKVMYHEWAFGQARLTFPDLDIPHTVDTTIAMLDHGQSLLRDALRAHADADLDAPKKTNWGELWPAWRVFWVMSDHDALHGGIVGGLRDLYHWTAGDQAAMSRPRPAKPTM